MDDETRLFYDLEAERIADEWYANDVLMPTIQEFLSLLPDKPKVLDLGCGPGYESMRLNSAGAEVVGVDFSPESIRIARERCPQCSFFELDFRQLDNRWGIFDGVFASASLIHITPEELPGVLNRIAKILGDRGKLLMIVQNGQGTRENWPEINGRKLRRVINLYSKEVLESLVTSSSFRLIKEGYLASELVDVGWRCYILKTVRN
jgi:SAM-dependent methyltransferase